MKRIAIALVGLVVVLYVVATLVPVDPRRATSRYAP